MRACGGVALPLLGVLVSACAGMPYGEPVHVYVAGIEPLPSEGLEVRMNVKLRVQNPNDAPIRYDGASLTMQVEGRTFASGVSAQSGTVPRFGEGIVEVPVSISAFSVLRSATGLLGQQTQESIRYELKGKLAGPAFKSVRFSTSGDLALPQNVYRRSNLRSAP